LSCAALRYAIPYVWIVRPELQERGTDVIVARDTRRIPPGSVDPTVKNFHWGDCRGLFEARPEQLAGRSCRTGNGLVTEGPGFNVFARWTASCAAPSAGCCTASPKTAIEIAESPASRCGWRILPGSALYRAGNLLTSTRGGVMPVAQLDGAPSEQVRRGPVTSRIRDRYWELHTDPRLSEAVDYNS